MPADAPPPEAITSPQAYAARLDAVVAAQRPDLAEPRGDGRGAFQRFLSLCAPGFRPTVRADLMGKDDATLFADAFDAAMAYANRPERAVRYGF